MQHVRRSGNPHQTGGTAQDTSATPCAGTPIAPGRKPPCIVSIVACAAGFVKGGNSREEANGYEPAGQCVSETGMKVTILVTLYAKDVINGGEDRCVGTFFVVKINLAKFG